MGCAGSPVTQKERPGDPSLRVVEHFRHWFAATEPASSLDMQIQRLKEENQRLGAEMERLKADSVRRNEVEALAAAAVEHAAKQNEAQQAERDAGFHRSLQDTAAKAQAAEQARAREAKQSEKARAVAEAVTKRLAAANEVLRAENELLTGLNVEAEAKLGVRCSLCTRTSKLLQSQSELDRFVAGPSAADGDADGQRRQRVATQELAAAGRDTAGATGNG